MVMSDYEPGTIALATVRGVPNVQAFRLSPERWVTPEVIKGTRVHSADDVTDVRPLVVLDEPEFYYETAVPELREIAQEGGRSLRLHNILHSIANQIEAQTRPPKPAEPSGLGAVVEDSDGVRWVNVFEKGMWQDHRDRNNWLTYDDIAAVRVLSEGVQP